jgi:flagellar motor switch/type III secretory pathway protein FliN
MQTHQITLVLNPDWVYEQLPKSNALKTVISPIDETLKRQKLTLNVELNPINLPVSQLVGLQVGDVIVLNHPLTTPIRVTKNKQVIAQAELGSSLNQKSILLRTSL